MGPRLRLSVSNGHAYPPTSQIQVNTGQPTPIDTGSFKGDVTFWIKDYKGEESGEKEDEYFGKVKERGEKRNLTYAIIMRGEPARQIRVDV